MNNLFNLLVFCGILVGCQKVEYKPELPCNGCENLEHPKPFRQTYKFTDWRSEEVLIDREVYFDSIGIFNSLQGVYHIETRLPTVVRHYYSRELPHRSYNNLLTIVQLNGGENVYLDNVPTKIEFVSVEEVELDEENAAKKKYMEEYFNMRDNCPAHGRYYGPKRKPQ